MTTIHETVLTPFTRRLFQIAVLVIGAGLLLGAVFYDTQALTLILSALATLYVIVGFVFKPKLRQHIYRHEDAIEVTKSALMSQIDKWASGSFIVMAVASNIHILVDATMPMLANLVYQICLSAFVYKQMTHDVLLILPLTEKYIFLENKQSDCLLMQRFDIYSLTPPTETLPESEEKEPIEAKEQALQFIGTLSLVEEPFEGEDARAVLTTLNQHLSLTLGNTETQKSWPERGKAFVLSLAGLYVYVVWLPELFKLMFPVGRYRNKHQMLVTRTEDMSDFGVYFMMFIMFITLAVPCLIAVFTFYQQVRRGMFKATCITNEDLWLLTPSIKGHYSRTISRTEMAYISYAYGRSNTESSGPIGVCIDHDIKLIGVDNNLISLNGWAWSGHFTFNHLVKFGLPVRLAQQKRPLPTE
ncbi:hypothetical protein [Vibrio cionasavignyae]|uniref:hypothetical protein n=1 Tax=Vibrio cionasavignyae TaxID=2910252 RepID=UPI003D09C558